MCLVSKIVEISTDFSIISGLEFDSGENRISNVGF